MSIFSIAQYFPIFILLSFFFLPFSLFSLSQIFSCYFKLVFAYLILSGIVFSCYYSD